MTSVMKTVMKYCPSGCLVYLLVVSPLGPALVLADDCAECTQAERDQLRIRTAHQMALSLNDLLEELERLARYPEAASLLLADHDGQLRDQLEAVLAAIQDAQPGAYAPDAFVHGSSLEDSSIQDLATEAEAGADPSPQPPLAELAPAPDLSGLRPVYAQLADAREGIQAEAILMHAGEEPLFLEPGSRFQHQEHEYTLRTVRPARGPDGGFDIYLESSEGNWEILTWQ